MRRFYTSRIALISSIWYLLPALYLSMLVSCPVAVAALERSSKKECAMCHVMWLDVFRTEKETLIKWQPGNVLMKDTQGIVSSEEICYSCHDGYVEDSRYSAWKYHNHTTFKKPSGNIRIPKNLTLSNRDEIYCGTCHSPHSGLEVTPWTSPEESIPGPLSFLRQPNIDSGLCESCHVNEADYNRTHGHPIHTDKLKIPEVLFEAGSVRSEKKDTVICQTCHKIHGAKGGSLTVIENDRSALCMTCHKERTIAGTSHDVRITMPDEVNVKGQTASESGPCGACHVPHQSAGFKLWARQMDPDRPVSQICLSCHTGKPDHHIKGVGRYSHPNNVDAASKDDPKHIRSNPTDRLPYFTEKGQRQPFGRIQCFTCHNVHQWDPAFPDVKGLKNEEGNGSDSFLRIACSRNSRLCMECHRSQTPVLSSDHNLVLTAPQIKNIQGFTAEISGPCGACHIPHNAAGPMLWARKINKDEGLMSQYCLDCHNETGAAKDKVPGANDHPVNVELREFDIADPERVSLTLPLFSKDGGPEPGGTVRCLTCHQPHRWDPLQAGQGNPEGLKNQEGDGRSSFLRIANAPSSELCEICHRDKAVVEGTDHDLSVTAPNAKNLLGETVEMSGACSACHVPHNSLLELKLWARPYGPVSPDNHPMDGLCTSCHSKGNIAKNKVPRIATHPKGKLIENYIRFENPEHRYKAVYDKEALVYTPIFDNRGKRTNVGNLSCPSCHNAHQWDASSNEKGSYKNVEGNAKTSFLRSLSYKNVCVNCHGRDAIFRYRLFHDPEKRGGMMGDDSSKSQP